MIIIFYVLYCNKVSQLYINLYCVIGCKEISKVRHETSLDVWLPLSVSILHGFIDCLVPEDEWLHVISKAQ